MGIVIVTIQGENKRLFVNSLYKRTGGKVDLVIIQKRNPNHRSFFASIKHLYKTVGLLLLLREFWYAFLLRINKSATNALEYFRTHSEQTSPETGYLANTMEVDSVNSDEVFDTLCKLSPDLMVVWGNTILKPEILETAGRAINLHMGLCPHYRGALANQSAVIAGEIEKIGATIHYAEARVDTGDIITTIKARDLKSPQELFRDLNDRAEKLYLDIAYQLFMGEKLPRTVQDRTVGKNFMLKDWIPSIRYKLAKKILEWEKSNAPLQKFDYRL